MLGHVLNRLFSYSYLATGGLVNDCTARGNGLFKLCIFIVSVLVSQKESEFDFKLFYILFLRCKSIEYKSLSSIFCLHMSKEPVPRSCAEKFSKLNELAYNSCTHTFRYHNFPDPVHCQLAVIYPSIKACKSLLSCHRRPTRMMATERVC